MSRLVTESPRHRGEVLRATGHTDLAANGSSAPGEELTKHSVGMAAAVADQRSFVRSLF